MNHLLFRPIRYLKMTIWTSVLCQLILWLGKKWQKMAKNFQKKKKKKSQLFFFFFFNFLKSFFACIFANNDFSLRFAKVRPCFSKKIFIFYHWILSFNLAIPCRNEQMNKVPPKMQFTVLKWGWNKNLTRCLQLTNTVSQGIFSNFHLPTSYF